MIKDKFVNSYLKNRIKQNAPYHHNLTPFQLREERLKQLAIDDLKGPQLEKVFDIDLQSFDTKKIKLRVYIPIKINSNKYIVVKTSRT